MDASNADYDEIIEILSKMFGFTKERTEHAIQVKLYKLGIYMTPREYFNFMLKQKEKGLH
ncbi:MAG: hypothetical protein HFJ97_07335 [Eubacterium sp.]|nr:hypothetical protein [Eubacterium sp.]